MTASRWYESRFTGLFSQFGAIPVRPHDPQIFVCAGVLPAGGGREEALAVGGAGWNADSAEAACVGEGIERARTSALPDDQLMVTAYDNWPLDEPAVRPDQWVLFHPEQYEQPGFPFQPFTTSTRCRWVCFRKVPTGEPYWVPEELAYLDLPAGESHCICACASTGLACGQTAEHALLRGLQEVIERDAVMGAWWGRYALEEWPSRDVLKLLGEDITRRILRPNLRYRFFRIDSPFADHVTLVTLEGDDIEGYCFSIGSCCREQRQLAWEKSLLEAIQGRHYVRHLKRQMTEQGVSIDVPTTFADHAVYYSLFPERLEQTVLVNPIAATGDGGTRKERLLELVKRLGACRPVLFRTMTPPSIARQIPDQVVVKVVVPGLHPMHGNHLLPHLGGSLWTPRGLDEWVHATPHPFP